MIAADSGVLVGAQSEISPADLTCFRSCKIKSFHLRLSLAGSAADRLLSEALTLLYLGTPLEINDAKIQPGVPTFVTLDRIRTAGSAEVVYSSDRVIANDGTVRVNTGKSSEMISPRGITLDRLNHILVV